MEIEYKFDKSSKSRDCVTESVKLEIITIKDLTEEEVRLALGYEDLCETEYITEETIAEVDLAKGYMEGEYCFNFSKYNNENLQGRELRGFCNFRQNSIFDTDLTDKKFWELLKESKQFTSQQELKDYINTIQEPIEFIAESSIDDVLMKEWIGDWKYKKEINNLVNYEDIKIDNISLLDVLKSNLPQKYQEEDTISINEYTELLLLGGEEIVKAEKGWITYNSYFNLTINNRVYYIEVEHNYDSTNGKVSLYETDIKVYLFSIIKTGSPKLNSNWTFKIKN